MLTHYSYRCGTPAGLIHDIVRLNNYKVHSLVCHCAYIATWNYCIILALCLLIDTTKPRAEVVIFGLSGGFATTLLIILVILPCVTAIGCCVYHHRKAGCRGGSYCRVSKKTTVV